MTPEPTAIHATWLLWLPSSSSQTTTSSDFWLVKADDARMAGTLLDSHVSPVDTEQSCMSLHRFGVMKT